MDLIELTSGDVALTLAPPAGGGIAAFAWRGRDVMRPATPGVLAARDPLGMAAFPLVPWSNRIRDGRFTWAGRQIALPLTEPGGPNAMHGHGWRNPWTVMAHDATTADLRYDHAADEWPWDYRAEQHFAVRDDGFDWTVAVTNRSAEAMPAGLGVHPYFPNPAATRLHAHADGWWNTDAAVMPLDYVEAPSDDWTSRLHAATTTDNVFAGFGGHYLLSWPDHRLDLQASDAARWMVIYAPAGDTVTVVEPVTHPTDALNDPALPGIRILQPGETFALDVHYHIMD